MLTVQSEIWPLLNKIWADFDEIFRIALQWYKEQLIKFWSDLDHYADSPNWESGQHEGNKLPWPRRTAVSSALVINSLVQKLTILPQCTIKMKLYKLSSSCLSLFLPPPFFFSCLFSIHMFKQFCKVFSSLLLVICMYTIILLSHVWIQQMCNFHKILSLNSRKIFGSKWPMWWLKIQASSQVWF